MDPDEGQEGSDLFQEIQEKVDREMFQEPDAGVTRTPDSLMEQVSRTPAGSNEFEVVVDLIDPDAMETEVEDAFLEEVDSLPPESETQAADSRESSDAGDSVETEAPWQAGSSPEPEEAFVEEDELFLGELIGREMGGSVEAEGTAERLDNGETVSPSSMEQAGDGAEEKDALNTRTLADLYADQGHYGQAIEIYARLARDDPGNAELQAELRGLREKQRAAGVKPLVEEAGVSESDALPGASGTETTRRLEDWLARIQSEKERRCLRNS